MPESDSGIDKSYAFRTPSLRNLSATVPYMHNGVFPTLGDVVNFYVRISRGRGGRGGNGGGGRGLNAQVSRDQIDPLARALDMRGRGQRDLIAFLQALDDPTFDKTIVAASRAGCPLVGASVDTPLCVSMTS